MTPKEKAKELVKKYLHELKGNGEWKISQTDNRSTKVLEYKIFGKKTKQCALITVDEILEEYSNEIVPYLYGSRFGFWQQVKEEIVSL